MAYPLRGYGHVQCAGMGPGLDGFLKPLVYTLSACCLYWAVTVLTGDHNRTGHSLIGHGYVALCAPMLGRFHAAGWLYFSEHADGAEDLNRSEGGLKDASDRSRRNCFKKNVAK